MTEDNRACFHGFAPGKLILLGEHAVVYGAPAIGVPLQKGVNAHLRRGRGEIEIELDSGLLPPEVREAASPEALIQKALKEEAMRYDIKLHLQIPPMCGYGSSASVGVALLRALAASKQATSSRDQLWLEALEVERTAHASPSGIDPAVVVWNEPIVFRLETGPDGQKRPIIEEQPIGAPLVMLSGWSGSHGGTRASVQGLRELRTLRPKAVTAAMKTLAEASLLGQTGLREGELEAIGLSLNLAHGVLAGLGLVSDEVEAAVRKLRAAGALGAKMSGAGGLGGAWLGLFAPEQAREAASRLELELGPLWQTPLFGKAPTTPQSGPEPT